jgi:fucose permease
MGALAVSAKVPVAVHLGFLGTVITVTSLLALRHFPAGSGSEPRGVTRDEGRTVARQKLRILLEPRTILVALFVFGMAFAEGTANDWLPLALVQGYGADAPTASAGFALFVGAMTTGRLAGGYFVNRFGRTVMLRFSASVASLGILLVVVSAGPVMGALGIVLWGFGAALGFPIGLSAAGDEARGASVRVSAVATVGYAAFLIGPPFLGALGDSIGLLQTLILALAFTLLALLLSGATRPAAHDREVEAQAESVHAS